MSFLTSSSHLFFGLPNGLVNIGFHSYTYLTIMGKLLCIESRFWDKWDSHMESSCKESVTLH
jgi:hypothetical protein